MASKPKRRRGENVVAIIQARMGSTRLPEKVLAEISGETILSHIIKRIRRVKVINDIVVAVSTEPRDEAIIREAAKYNVPCIMGDNEDVLARFRTAARIMHADTVVRVTADNPLVSPEMMTRIVNVRKKHRLDYVAVEGLPVGTGTEVLTMRTVVAVDRLTTLQRHREHVTLYIKENQQDFQTKFMRAPVNVFRPHYRLTVDTIDDLEVVRSLVRDLPDRKHEFSLPQIVKFLDTHPEYLHYTEEVQKVAA